MDLLVCITVYNIHAMCNIQREEIQILLCKSQGKSYMHSTNCINNVTDHFLLSKSTHNID